MRASSTVAVIALAGPWLAACEAKTERQVVDPYEALRSIPVTTQIAELKKQGLVETDQAIKGGGGCKPSGVCYSTIEQIGFYYGSKPNPGMEPDHSWFCPVPKEAQMPSSGEWSANDKASWMCGRLHD